MCQRACLTTRCATEGLVSLCESLGVDPASDVRVLVMFWKFRAETQATLTREEFVSGMTAAG